MLENPLPNPTATPGPRVLNQRDFLAGLQCHKQLWWRVHEPDAAELIPDSNTRALMEAGRQIGQVAREHTPGGRLIDFRHQARASRVAATGLDILERGSDGWTLTEVTSSVEVSRGTSPTRRSRPTCSGHSPVARM